MVLLSRPLAMQPLWLRQGEALRCRAPGAQPGPGLLGRRPALLQPGLQAGSAWGCVAHALPALLKCPLKARILQNRYKAHTTGLLPALAHACQGREVHGQVPH